MNELQLINKNGVFHADSRQIAAIVGKRHSNLLRDIERYREYLTRLKIDCNNYFIKSSYKIKGNNKTYPCYLISKMGCEFIENKMTGKRGALFTFKYLQRNGEK